MTQVLHAAVDDQRGECVRGLGVDAAAGQAFTPPRPKKTGLADAHSGVESLRRDVTEIGPVAHVLRMIAGCLNQFWVERQWLGGHGSE